MKKYLNLSPEAAFEFFLYVALVAFIGVLLWVPLKVAVGSACAIAGVAMASHDGQQAVSWSRLLWVVMGMMVTAGGQMVSLYLGAGS